MSTAQATVLASQLVALGIVKRSKMVKALCGSKAATHALKLEMSRSISKSSARCS